VTSTRRIGKLSLIDLAGSERAAVSKVSSLLVFFFYELHFF
jgi:hypothetical protein